MKKTILLIHGWDYNLYTKMTNSNDAWGEYNSFINMLEEKYNLIKVNLPGFCSSKEPDQKSWNISDFSKYINECVQNKKIDIIIGYSFGGAVAVDYKVTYKSSAKLFLIAPAIIRNMNNSKKFAKTPSLLMPIRNKIRDLYVSYIIKNNEMRYGTKFLKNTYQNIVRVDKTNDLYKINSNDLCILYGSKDTAVNPNKMISTINDDYKKCIKTIENANHDNIIINYVNDIKKELNKFDK